MKLQIDRTRWLRGDHYSFLLRRDDAKMCCLGFLAKQCGYSDEDILGVGGLEELTSKTYRNLLPNGIMSDKNERYNSSVTNLLMRVNDTFDYKNDAPREDRLIELFAEIDIEVEFVG